MIDAGYFLRILARQNVNFYSCVSDPLLNEFFFTAVDYSNEIIYQTACNDKAAIGVAIGSYLATGYIPAVYLKNSGLYTVVNPFYSTAKPEVYGIPLLLIVGWQNETDTEKSTSRNKYYQHDELRIEPIPLLQQLRIPYKILGECTEDWEKTIESLLTIAHNEFRPVALVVKKISFSTTKATSTNRKVIFNESVEKIK
ncbi:thiamine pyrophosphate-binding protein [Candidatus Regiella insecticola]|uniref:thiamine pyrophosphate-binding protein n=1 Tax=Candidatus Regiella insecticola TaxID=138073 RepID=UPI0015967750|nr:thiamine pyrophosphate-binding protein [Candidatus Regiella insecticola]